MNTQLAILIVYVALLLGLAAWATRLQAKTAAHNKMLSYLLAGRNMPAAFVAVMLIGLAIGGASTVGVAQTAYTKGLSAGWYNGAWGAGGIFVGLFAAGYLRKMRVKTVPEMVGLMYGPKTRFLSVISQLLVMITITSLQYVAGGAILSALMPDVFPSLRHGMVVTAAIFVLITVMGGYWASGLTNLVNVVVIYIGIIAALFQTFGRFGGLESIKASLPPGGWFALVGSAPESLGGWAVAGYLAVMITMAVSTQAATQIVFSAKDEKTARLGMVVGGVIILPAGFLCALFGVVAAAKFPGLNPALALPTIAAELTPLVGGVFLAALWAADISTAVGLLMGCSTLVLEDIVKKAYKKPIADRNQLAVSRATVLCVSALSFLLALTVSSILSMLTTALAVTTSFTLLILANIYAPRLCKRAAGFPVVLASLILWLVWTLLPALESASPALEALNIRGFFKGQLIYPEWLVCLLIFAACAVFGKNPADKLLPQEDL
ncbi:sodium:solute symporter family protein [Treponema endosymbiont of Eucomonympha sp.]|uniref:sodium:solute symporter family protein n=2 Tax=Treponema endosymbiont of Eucomonympha sp. TaxID=1580831 RepID=UPI0007856528|nr:sodium:solute symporter family protein [Treponema endosymbiont of Eucomonympha sp.]